MCGKFTQMATWRQVHDWSRIARAEDLPKGNGEADEELVTPMRFAGVLHLDAMGRRVVTSMKWGWPRRGAGMNMHARAETIDEPTKPFLDSFVERRGLLICQTFNEGQVVGSKTVQYTMWRKDGLPAAIAVVWKEIVHAETGEITPCFVMVSVPANAALLEIGEELVEQGMAEQIDRMPAVMPDNDWAGWLGETDAYLGQVKGLLRTHEFGEDWELIEQRPKSKAKPKPTEPPRQASLF